MAVADAEQWLGIALVVAWCVAALVAATPAGRALVARYGRRPAPVVVGSGAAAVLFAAQAGVVDAVADPGPLARVDTPVLDWFVGERSTGSTWVMEHVSAYGGTAGMAVLAAAGAGVLWWRRRRSHAVALLVAAAGAGLLSSGFKTLYDRARPPAALRLTVENNPSLPSGHALGSIVVVGMLAALVWVATASVAVRVAAVSAAAAVVALIGASRLYLGVHWFTDVLTGWLLGGAWLAVCVTATALWTAGAAARPGTPATTGAERSRWS